MSYDSLQRSIQDSQAVELYEWTAILPGLFGDFVPPTGPLLVSDPLALPDCAGFTDGWAPHGNLDGHGFAVIAGGCHGEGVDGLGDCFDIAPLSAFYGGEDCVFLRYASTFDSVEGTGTGIYIRSIFSGGIGSGGGYHYLEKTFGVSDGLLPGVQYHIQVLCKAAPPPPYGFRQLGMDLNFTGGVTATTGIRSASWHTLYGNATADGSGNLNVRLGDMLMEYGMGAVHMNFRDLKIYATSGTPPESGGGQSTSIYRFTSADRPIVFQGNTYLPAILRRGPLHRGSGEISASELVVTVAREMDFVQEYFAAEGTPSAPLSLRMYRVEPTDMATYAIPFVGDVMFGSFSGAQIEMTCMTPEARMKRRLPSLLNQPRCNWITGDEDCRIDHASFSHTGEVTAISVDGRTLTVTGSETARGADSAYFVNGAAIAPNGERGFILGTNGDDVILMDPIQSLTVGDDIILLAGDDYTIKTCQDRFGNARRFSGTTLMQPIINPHVSGLQ